MVDSLSAWYPLAVQAHNHITAIACQPFDRPQLFAQFQAWSRDLGNLPLYLSNPGYPQLQQVISASPNGFQVQPTPNLFPAPISHPSALLTQLQQTPQSGIFIVEGLSLQGTEQHQLHNLFEQLRVSPIPCHLVLVAEHFTLPVGLHGMVPLLKLPYPDLAQVEAVVERCLTQFQPQGEGQPGDRLRLRQALQGLGCGEMDWVLAQQTPWSDSVAALAQRVLDYKIAKLRGRGLEFIGQPDVPQAAGLDLLDARLERIAALLDPAAAQHHLKFPTGMLLWGLPGTGKSLSAKLAAKTLGVPLLSADWNGLRGATSTESLANLRFLLDTAEAISPCVLYFDDFDKGFAGWDTDITAKQSAQRLLTWMQEHTAPVLVLATVNRLGLLPVELQRRLPEVFFFDLPHDGARYDIFNLHLALYFPAFRLAPGQPSPFTDGQWRELLTAYRLCIPDEIGNAVRRVAEDCFYQHWQDGRGDQPLQVTFEQLLAQRQAFTPALVREEGPMLEIRNHATYAKPVSSPDTSRFARPQQELFECGVGTAGN